MQPPSVGRAVLHGNVNSLKPVTVKFLPRSVAGSTWSLSAFARHQRTSSSMSPAGQQLLHAQSRRSVARQPTDITRRSSACRRADGRSSLASRLVAGQLLITRHHATTSSVRKYRWYPAQPSTRRGRAGGRPAGVTCSAWLLLVGSRRRFLESTRRC